MAGKRVRKKVAIYHGRKNVSGETVAAALSKWHVPFAMVTAREIESGRLADFAAVVFPGGHSIGLSKRGVAAVIRFVESGGGFLGICAGCQFGVATRLIPVRWKPLRASGIFDMRVVRRHPVTRGYVVARKWRKGTPWKYSNRGRVRMRYCNGGVLRAGRGVTVVVTFDEEGGMGAIVAAGRGRGRVVLISSHPESTPPPAECGRFASRLRRDRSQDPLRLLRNAVAFVGS